MTGTSGEAARLARVVVPDSPPPLPVGPEDARRLLALLARMKDRQQGPHEPTDEPRRGRPA